MGIVNGIYVRKEYDLILQELIEEYQTRINPNLEFKAEDVVTQIVSLQADQDFKVQEDLEAVVDEMLDWLDSEEPIQDRFYKAVSGITRQEAVSTVTEVKIIGDPFSTVKDDFTIRVPNRNETASLIEEETELDGDGFATVNFICKETGEIIILENTLTEIVTPKGNVESVNNENQGITGANRESREEFKIRHENALAAKAGTIEAMVAAVNNVDGVTTTFASENKTDTAINEQPPKTFTLFVSGGTEEDIANAMLDSKALGTTDFGTINVELVDARFEAGITIMSFDRIVTVVVEVKAEIIQKEGGQSLPSNTEQLAEDSILEYFSKLKSGFSVIGSDIETYIRVSLPINTTDIVNVLLSSTQLALVDVTVIPIDRTEVGYTDTNNIDITVEF